VSSRGRVRYRGQQFVTQKGDEQRWLSARDIGKLRKAIVESGFSSFDSQCCSCREHTDHPSTVIQVVTDGVLKTIEHYQGCSTTPRTIPILEDEIVFLTGAVRWIGNADQSSRRSRSQQSR